MTTCDELKHIHEAAMDCLSHLHHFSSLLENWDHLGESDEYMDSSVQGMRRAVEGLVAAFARRPPSASPGRQVMIRGARAAATSPSRLCGESGACLHDAVFRASNQVINLVALAIGWKEWTHAGPDQPAPESANLEQLDLQSAAEIVNLFHGIQPLRSDDGSDLRTDVLKSTESWLEIEFNAAMDFVSDEQSGPDDRMVQPGDLGRAVTCDADPPAIGGASPSASRDCLTLETKALATLVAHPDWSDTQIADHVGCSRTSLYRWEKFKAARGALKSSRKEMPRADER